MLNLFFVGIDRTKKLNNGINIFNFFAFFFIILPIFIVIYHAFNQANGIENNVAAVNMSNVKITIKSLYVAFVTVLFVFLLGYPFAYFVSEVESKKVKSLLILLISSPLWSSYFVKLLGLKTFFDLLYGSSNSTSGIIYVIIGLVYIHLPIAILSFYNVLTQLPRNLINASYDLGSTPPETFSQIILPYTKEALLSAIFLVFLPAFTTVTVADFMDRSPGGSMIGQVINNFIIVDISGSLPKSRASFLTLFVSSIVFLVYFLVKFLPKFLQQKKDND
ncbi:polyamine ABC transporter permease [Candidatus Mycoplasma haematobovis]|uniref:Polyamine ABC transporter permease n=1 Tax=Candidatus Mycoplasma haematobovis TaxID=432608 RepID=A0A1A9QCD7_9MOLU|nr:ABC transporter permease subunit [Candidatus Mycoplasma haematobovis]OAL10242.1 polyamine ABC transporter permease [Candidatus Mycoplasma haematobovis]